MLDVDLPRRGKHARCLADADDTGIDTTALEGAPHQPDRLLPPSKPRTAGDYRLGPRTARLTDPRLRQCSGMSPEAGADQSSSRK
jgi:hypothetical protein